MGSPEYKDAFHPKHDSTTKRVQEIYAELGRSK